MDPPLEFKVTAPVERVVSPVTVKPSKLLHAKPSKFTEPAKLLPVLPLASVTFPRNCVEPAASVDTIPLFPKTVPEKTTAPLTLRVRDAPVPSPRPLTAPVKDAVSAVTVKSWLFPVRLLLKVMLLPVRIRADAASSVTAPVYV